MGLEELQKGAQGDSNSSRWQAVRLIERNSMKRGESEREAKVVRARVEKDGRKREAVGGGSYMTVTDGQIRYGQRCLHGTRPASVVPVLRITVQYKRTHKRIPQIVLTIAASPDGAV